MRRVTEQRQCGCVGCGRKVEARFDGVWYCNMHYLRMYTHGDLEYHGRKRTTKLVDNGDSYVKIITAKGEEILIDKCDIDAAMRCSWCISRTGYPVANIEGRVVKMHRYLLGLLDSKELVDHKNGNPLDNRRENLRVCSFLENARNHGLNKNNTSGVAGVEKTISGRWRARITINRIGIQIGTYDTIEEAQAARQEAERKYYGEFAPNGRNVASRTPETRVTLWEV